MRSGSVIVPIDQANPSLSIEVEVKNLTVFIGEYRALNDVSFALYRNRVTAIIGPSGCGKSVLLKTMVGLLPEEVADVAITGEVIFEGRNIIADETPIEAIRNKMIYLSQYPAIFPGSVFENVVSVLEYWGPQHRSTSPGAGGWLRSRMARSELEDRVESALRGVALWDEIKDRLHKDAAILSTGQRQRLCLARALALRPKVLLLDEPTANLDPITIQRVEETLAELKIDYTILIVTHNMQQAARTSDHAVNMYLGELVEFDETERIFTHPRDRRTEDYITGRYG